MENTQAPEQIIDIHSTPYFDKWYAEIKSAKLIAAINRRLDNIAIKGLFGDHKNIEGKINELRIFLDAGYRVYYTFDGVKVVLLLCGGDKSSQSKDIQKAKEILREVENEA